MRLKLRTNVRRIFIITILVWSYPTLVSLAVGGGLMILGQIIHFIASGYLVKQEQLITAGPYRYLRNPFYLANFLLDIGLCIIALNPYVAAVYLSVFYSIVINWRIKKEEAFLKERFGQDYIDYCRNVPRFFPRLTPADITAQGEFSWAQITRHLEQWRFVRVVGLIVFFYLRAVTMEYVGQVWHLGDVKGALVVLSQPVNIAIAVVLVVILFLPPIWVFVIRSPQRHDEHKDQG